MFDKKEEHVHNWGKWIVIPTKARSEKQLYTPYGRTDSQVFLKNIPAGSKGIRVCTAPGECYKDNEQVRTWEEFPPPVICEVYGDKARRA